MNAVNENSQEPEGTNENEVPDYQHATAPEIIHFAPKSQDDHSTFSSTGD